MIKSNLAKFPKPIGFTFDDQGLLHFGDAPQGPKVESQLDRAIDFLLVWLAKEPQKADDLKERLAAESYLLANCERSKT